MARGFESKDVEFQQAEAERRSLSRGTRESIDSRRHTIELSLSRMRAELVRAVAPAHRRMIQAAIASLETELQTCSD